MNHHIIDMRRICFLKLDNSVSLLPKNSLVHCFLTQNNFFAMEIANHHDKPLTPSEICDQDRFFEPGFWVWSYSNYEARIFTTLWPANQGEHLDRLLTRQSSSASARPLQNKLSLKKPKCKSPYLWTQLSR